MMKRIDTFEFFLVVVVSLGIYMDCIMYLRDKSREERERVCVLVSKLDR